MARAFLILSMLEAAEAEDNYNARVKNSRKAYGRPNMYVSMNMSRADTIRLIQQYGEHRLLWDMEHPHHLISKMRKECWMQIASESKWPINVLKRKIASLLGFYRRELNKERKSRNKAAATGSKNVYSSKWYGYPYFNYIREKKRPLKTRRTISTDDSQLSPQGVNEGANEDANENENQEEVIEEANEEVNEEVIEEVNEEVNEDENQEAKEEAIEEVNEEAIEEADENPNEDENEDVNEDANMDPNEDANMDENEYAIEDADGLQEELEEVMIGSPKPPSPDQSPEEPKEELDTECEEENHALTHCFNVNNDLYNSFGNYIACELRKYDPRTLAYVKHAINDVIFKADLGNLEMDTFDDSADPPQSPSSFAAEEDNKQSPAVSDAEI